MTRLQLRFSHRHILPIIPLYLLVVSCVDLGTVFEMSRLFAIAIYSSQIIISIVAFYAFLLFNILDLTRTYVGQVRAPAWFLRMLPVAAPLLTYVVFFCRICLLSFLEAASVTMLIGTCLLGIRIGHSSAIYWLLPLGIMVASIHMWIERNNLGTKALKLKDG